MKKLKGDKEKLADIKDKSSHAKAVLNPMHDKFKEFERLYWGQIEKSKNSWKSAVFDNISFEAVERLVSHLLATTPRGRFLPAEPSDELGAIVMDQLFRYQWRLPGMNMPTKMRNMGLQAGIFGAGFGVLDWRFEEQKIKKTEVNEFGEVVEVEQMIEKYDCPFFKDLYIYDLLFEPEATSIEDMDYYMYDDFTTLSQLKIANRGGEKRYKNLGKLESKIKDSLNAEQSDNRKNVSEIRGMDGGDGFERLKIRHYRSRKKWLSYAVDYDILIEDIDNPYWHGDLNIHMIRDYTYPNQLLGRGEIEPIITQQRALNSVLNQRLDNVRLILNTPFKAKASSRYAKTWKIAPGYINVVEDNDELSQMVIQDVTGDTFLQTQNYFKDTVSRQLGYVDFTTRNETNNDKTATEIRSATGEQNARIADKEKSIDEFVARLNNQWALLDQQFMNTEKLIRIVGSDAIKLLKEKLTDPDSGEVDGTKFQEIENTGYLLMTPDDIKGSYDFIVETGSMSSVDSESKIAGYTLAINTLQGAEENLAKEGTKVNLKPILEKQLRELGIKEVDEVLEVMSEQEQQMIAQQNMMQNQPRLDKSIIA